MGQERGKAGQGGSKEPKPIPTPPCGAGLKSRPFLAPPPLRGRECGGEARRGGTKLLFQLRSTRRGFVRLWADSIDQYVTTMLNFVKILITIYKINTIQ